jgi:hypothetical protein
MHGKLPALVSVALTFLGVLVSLVFFRANGVQDAVYVLGTMVGAHGLGAQFAGNPWIHGIPNTSFFLHTQRGASITVALCFLIVWAMPNTQEIFGQIGREAVRLPSLLPKLSWRPNWAWSVTLTILFCAAILMLDANAQFLYFQF